MAPVIWDDGMKRLCLLYLYKLPQNIPPALIPSLT